MRGTIAEVPGPRLDGWTASDRNSLYPRFRIGFTFFCIFGLDETHVLSHIKLIDVEVNATNVAGIQSKLKFRIGKKDIRDTYRECGVGDGVDLLLGLIVVTSLTFLELCNEPAVQLQRLYVARVFFPLAVFDLTNRTLAVHPFGIVEERIVVPVRLLAGLEGFFEFVGHTITRVIVATHGAHRHRDKVIKM